MDGIRFPFLKRYNAIMKSDLRKLQKLIDACVKAHNDAFDAEQALNAECESVYKYTPADEDLDEIIDACFGGCGKSSGMDAAYFDKLMVAFRPKKRAWQKHPPW